MIKINYEKLQDKNGNTALWGAFGTMLFNLKHVLMHKQSTHSFIGYVEKKTFGFLKLKEKLSTKDIHEYCFLQRHTVYHIKSDLIADGLLLKLENNYYCLNVYGIAYLYREVFEKYYSSSAFLDEIIEHAKELLSKEGVFSPEKIKIDEERKMKLEKILKENQEYREKKKENRKQQRIKKAKISTARNVGLFAQMICEDAGVAYGGKGWGGKEFGQAKNWLRECDRYGQDPKEILTQVCSNWKDIQHTVKDRFGKRYLNEVFSFPEYYKYRDAITKALINGLDRQRELQFEITYIKKGEKKGEAKLSVG